MENPKNYMFVFDIFMQIFMCTVKAIKNSNVEHLSSIVFGA